jgi:CheY-like chemotaxis protein
MMGGEIHVESEVGTGSEFVFTLNLKEAANPAGTEKESESEVTGAASIPSQSNGSLKGVRILVAEDNPVNQKLVEIVLRQMGCEVDLAANGQEVVEQLRKKTYDLCLMDIQMPVMGGIEAACLIRKEISRDLPLIALTASAMQRDRERCFEAGMNDFLSKPIEIQKLRGKISQWSKNGDGKESHERKT